MAETGAKIFYTFYFFIGKMGTLFTTIGEKKAPRFPGAGSPPPPYKLPDFGIQRRGGEGG